MKGRQAVCRTKLEAASGFTLIELTIVIIIIALASALIAPLSLKELNKSNAKIEFLTVRNTIKTMSSQAFARGIGYRVTLAGSTMTVESVKGQQVFPFEYLQFPGVSFFVNHNGFPSIDAVTIKVGTQDRQLTMEDMLGVKQDLIYAQTP